MIGTRLAHYEISAHLGSGGMGDVYQATDSKLGRSVAIKVLPEAFARDAERLARFEREARVLASLNHPHIATIHGLEEAGGVKFLVMELATGETLAERIARGPILIDETLPIAKQIAEALEAAHEKGIVHRDLKPANIKIAQDGNVKVLDFGLAKAFEGEAANVNLSNSPTLSLAATQAGIILGTAAYMSPEQAKGKTVDRRADIWAFGVLVAEMLTGRMLFSGETASETMAQVMLKEPDWTTLPADTPVRIRDLLRRCLMKEPRNRMRDIGDVRIAIEEAIAQPEAESSRTQAVALPAALTLRARLAHALPWALVVVLAAGSTALLSLRRVPAAPALRLAAELGADVALDVGGISAPLALSPDGQVLAFMARGTGRQLYVRRLDQLEAVLLPGTEGARAPFFSPDGQWIAFFADGKLKKTKVTGGAPLTLCDAPDDRGGHWAEDGSIIFAPLNTQGSGLTRVSAAGGTPEPLTKPDEAAGEFFHAWPQLLPGGQTVLFTAFATSQDNRNSSIVVQSLRSGERRVVRRGGSHARYVASGHLVYANESTLFAAPFDLERLEMTGEPSPVLEGVTPALPNGGGGARFSLSESGTIAYVPGASVASGTSIYWMDRDGKTQPLRSARARYSNLRFSPDGRRMAVQISDQQDDVWVYEWDRDTITRLTSDPAADTHPVWTPDGRRITFASQRADNATANLFWQRADGTGEPQRLTESKNPQRPGSWHPSGKFLAFVETNPQTGENIMILPVEGDEASGWKPGTPTAFLQTPGNESEPAFSPDGRWLAYQSQQQSSGTLAYVRPFPGPGGSWQVSSGRGLFPTWSRTGMELFFRSFDSARISVASYKTEGESFRADNARLLVERPFSTLDRTDRNFDLHPDGQRFAVLNTPESQTETRLDKVILVFNFLDELRRIAPTKK